jgi:hypothetical protein
VCGDVLGDDLKVELACKDEPKGVPDVGRVAGLVSTDRSSTRRRTSPLRSAPSGIAPMRGRMYSLSRFSPPRAVEGLLRCRRGGPVGGVAGDPARMSVPRLSHGLCRPPENLDGDRVSDAVAVVVNNNPRDHALRNAERFGEPLSAANPPG